MSIYGVRNPNTSLAKQPYGGNAPAANSMDNVADFSTSSSSEETLTLQDIIAAKPATKIVREFFRQNLANVKSAEEELFD